METETTELTPELYRTIVAIVDERMAQIKVTRKDCSALREVVERTAEAQARTEDMGDQARSGGGEAGRSSGKDRGCAQGIGSGPGEV